MNVLLIGPPGSGKGTQGSRLAERLGLEHLAAGDVLRAEVDAKTPIGLDAAGYVARGELVPDEVIIELMRPRVLAAGTANGYLLDGFPRSVGQAIEARKMAEEEDVRADAVIYLDVPRDDLIGRILSRAEIEGRTDDTPEIIANRLAVFDEATLPLVEYYRDRGLLKMVDASRSPDEVTADILRLLPNRSGEPDAGGQPR